MLSVNNARMVFHGGTPDEKIALNSLNLELAPLDFCVVIGTNGAGKSTMLNAISGKMRLDSGSISVNGTQVHHLPAFRRAAYISRVFQDPMLGTAASMTIGENMLLAELKGRKAGLAPGLTAARRRNYQNQLSEIGLGLEDRLDMQVGLLSGGQRQALSLIMAISSKPDLLLLDEHTAALDPGTAAIVMQTTVRAIQECKLTALMVTHNMEHAVQYGNKIVMLDAGRVAVQIDQQEKSAISVADLVGRFHTKSDAIMLQA